MSELAKYMRALPPAHYTLKIGSFSALSGLDKYNSRLFDAGGYTWSLSLYRNGNKDANGSGYISLYLSIKKKKDLRNGWKVDANCRLFVHNKLQNKYLTIQDAGEAVTTFRASKTRWGFTRFLSLENFKKHSNGYLVGDSCTFGAEVFVIDPTRIKEQFTLTRNPPHNTFSWKFNRFSKLGENPKYSDVFPLEGWNWNLKVYPKGNGDRNGKSLSVYLGVQNLPSKRNVYVECHLRVLDQLNHGNDTSKKVCGWLSASVPFRGYADFMLLKDLHKSAKGFIYGDALIVEFQIRAISSVVKS